MARGTPAFPRPLSLLLEAWLPIVLFAAWWVAGANSESLYFVSLRSILEAFRTQWLSAGAADHILSSMANLAAGYALATAVGIALGVALGLARPVGEALGPILEFLRSVPGVALLPLGLLILGVGSDMKIALITYGALWPILLNTIDGVRGVDAVVRDVSRSYRVPLRFRLTRIVLPSAGPQIIAGMRTSLSIAITVVVFSEMIGSTEGIGYSILQAQRNFAIPEMWAGMLLLGILGYLLNIAFRGVEHWVLRWHRAMTAAPRS
ncbi:ABC-type nitrate/sulfonate/bicarbonate transport system permease component [Thermocatellispora tengchongensis]|uniref:ABC-type nitrate/sulfonate/bicarbonate transport system permease component n=1 Tax=Thermocatellispora tengchongensis TaxID=1073253 RepID=A0A840PJX1_9ACTN|nr:ABC transporter permease subunit [Thermocatellispora tengchongensis]MBB5139828.1 ABC-type nitrate/sulfonate/bicarbonate transport system permease component [Thermocatellispora tengchongensis]